MRVFELRTQVRLRRPRPEVFAFFSDAANLQELTPPWLRFQILPPAVDMRAGARIDYRLRLRGLPVTWKTEITAWEPPRRFVDEQLRGPYRLWVHEHAFEEIEGGTLAGDRVRYALPGGTLGSLVGRLFVARDLKTIFRYRHARLRELFGSWKEDGGEVMIRAE